MTRSLSALVVLAILAAGLLVVLLVDGTCGSSSPPSRLLIPGLAPETITELSWSRANGQESHITLEGGLWVERMERASPGSLDPRPSNAVDQPTVGGVLSALRGAHWQRRAAKTTAGTSTTILTVTSGSSKHVVEIAASLLGADQTWLVVDGFEAVLVDGWVARAIDPQPLALRVRFPFADATASERIQLLDANLEIREHPRRLRHFDSRSGLAVRTGPDLWLAPQQVDKLEAALARLEIVAIPPPLKATRASIAVDQNSVADAGPCPGHPDLLGLDINIGGGCVSAAQWKEVIAIVELVASAQPSELADRRPAPGPATEIRFPGGDVLDPKTMTLAIAGHSFAADPQRVRELLTALAREVVRVEDVQADLDKAATRELIVVGEWGRTRLQWNSAGVVVRDVDLVHLHPGHDTLRVLERPALAYVDDQLWIEDPSTVRNIELDRVTYTRGAVLGEWTRDPAGVVDGPLLEALVAALAQVRAPSSEIKIADAHHVSVIFVPPVGLSSHHTLHLGPIHATGCAGRVDDRPVTLPLKLCMAVAAVAR